MSAVALYVAIILVTLVALAAIAWPVLLLLWLVLIVRRQLNRKAGTSCS
jgi:heme/copper-type cytochrome/quinol oxidase subunit 2